MYAVERICVVYYFWGQGMTASKVQFGGLRTERVLVAPVMTCDVISCSPSITSHMAFGFDWCIYSCDSLELRWQISNCLFTGGGQAPPTDRFMNLSQCYAGFANRLLLKDRVVKSYIGTNRNPAGHSDVPLLISHAKRCVSGKQ